MRTTNFQLIHEYVTNQQCSVSPNDECTYSNGIPLTLACFCGNSFEKTIRQLTTAKRRESILSCGCIDKKWTNSKIDETVQSRTFHRITDCNKRNFQPSCEMVEWECDICSFGWKSRVDSVINKQTGCPKCAGNLAYTADTLHQKLTDQGRTDLTVLDVFPGHDNTTHGKKSKFAKFKCTECSNEWSADIHNVIKFYYGCPSCNDNISTKVVDAVGNTFHSKIEYYFWTHYHEKKISYSIVRQQRYSDTRRLTCDYYIPEKQLWVEISGESLLNQTKYSNTIREKRSIVQEKGEQFIVLSTFSEINKLISQLA